MGKKVKSPSAAEKAVEDAELDEMLSQLDKEVPQPVERQVDPPIEPDFDEGDYIKLPDFGRYHYNVSDAAILAALDIYASGNCPELPNGADEWEDECDSSQVRKGIAPLQGRLIEAMIRSVESGHLDAVVLRRSLPDSRPIADHTYIHFSDLIEWMEVHGYERGPMIEQMEEEQADECWEWASATAEARAALRYPIAGFELQRDTTGSTDDEIAGLKSELENSRRHIAHLVREKAESRSSGGADKALTTRSRSTLLIIIAALCKRQGIKYSERGAATAIERVVDELGVHIDDETIRKALVDIDDAIERRSR